MLLLSLFLIVRFLRGWLTPRKWKHMPLIWRCAAERSGNGGTIGPLSRFLYLRLLPSLFLSIPWWIDRSLNGRMNEWMKERTEEWMDEWINERSNRQRIEHFTNFCWFLFCLVLFRFVFVASGSGLQLEFLERWRRCKWFNARIGFVDLQRRRGAVGGPNWKKKIPFGWTMMNGGMIQITHKRSLTEHDWNRNPTG